MLLKKHIAFMKMLGKARYFQVGVDVMCLVCHWLSVRFKSDSCHLFA